jgi:hypothetical protein
VPAHYLFGAVADTAINGIPGEIETNPPPAAPPDRECMHFNSQTNTYIEHRLDISPADRIVDSVKNVSAAGDTDTQ